MYKMLSEVNEAVGKGDFRGFRHPGAGGQNQFAGMSPFECAFAILISEFEEEIWNAHEEHI
jgi:hypothetical protein